jgi:hypothetical protein
MQLRYSHLMQLNHVTALNSTVEHAAVDLPAATLSHQQCY